MENVRISIPEFDERGLTYEESFRIIVIMLNHELYYLKNLHPSEAIDDLDAYPLQVAQRIVNMPNHYVMDLLDSLKKSQRVKK